MIPIAAGIAAALLAQAPAQAQEAFPARLVTVVNPNAPGGTADIITRGMTEPLQRAFKQSVITVNRPGAGGAVGGAAVASGPADGYTVLLNTVTHVLIPITDRFLGKSSGYTPEDYVLLARITADPLLLVVHPSLPAKSVQEFVALARRRPGEIVFSSTGHYGSGHVSMAMLMRSAKIDLLHSPFNGAGPGIVAVLGGHTQSFFAPSGVASPHLPSGRLRLLAQSGPKRVPAFSDTPTAKEAGYDVEFSLWTGYFAPVKTPAPAVRAWQAALREAAADPKFKASMEKVNVTVDHLGGDALKPWYDAELKRLDREIRAIGKIEARS
ncbi:MAG: tripartite tricarboxylate transporter substrate binding protein [Burkholderiales bacterium]|nr:tripartite tricarboxylate transporter substrate binding protein [Burkholderiales bacterium]